MKPLIVLLVVFGLGCLATFIAAGTVDYRFSGKLAMALMLVFTSIAHFKFSKGMAMMLPPWVPFKTGMVYLTGIIEIAAAAGLLIKALSHITGWVLIIFFVLLLPANIYAAINNINLEKASNTGNGPKYLWFRVPLQLLFIAWVYYFAVMN